VQITIELPIIHFFFHLLCFSLIKPAPSN